MHYYLVILNVLPQCFILTLFSYFDTSQWSWIRLHVSALHFGERYFACHARCTLDVPVRYAIGGPRVNFSLYHAVESVTGPKATSVILGEWRPEKSPTPFLEVHSTLQLSRKLIWWGQYPSAER